MITNGYGLGGVDSFTLPQMRSEEGRLKAGLANYRALVLPQITGIRIDTMQEIADFCRRGGIVIATGRLPQQAYGWKDRLANTARLRRLVKNMFGPQAGHQQLTQHRYGQGQAIFYSR